TMPTVNGLEIHHETQGEGPPIVFVHGLGATSNVWHAQRMTLSKSYRVIVYDRSGCGRSQKAPAGYSIDGWADELAGLLDSLAVPSAVVVGHSLGSMVAQRFAGKYAARTQALILAGGEAGPGTALRWQQEIAAALADSRIRVIPNTGHMTMLESPAVFNTVVLDFLATLGP